MNTVRIFHFLSHSIVKGKKFLSILEKKSEKPDTAYPITNRGMQVELSKLWRDFVRRTNTYSGRQSGAPSIGVFTEVGMQLAQLLPHLVNRSVAARDLMFRIKVERKERVYG